MRFWLQSLPRPVGVIPLRFVVVLLITLSGCTSKEQKEELLAKQYCGSCHSFPEPSLLDKKAWTTVMPQMAVRMGIDISLLTRLSDADYPYVVQTLPQNPMLTPEEFEAIMNYYEREAPDSLVMAKDFETKQLHQFDVTELKLLNQRPTITLLKADTINKKIWLSNRKSVLYKYDYDFKRIDTTQLTSPASSVVFDNDKSLVAVMGIMDPNDQPKGSVVTLDQKTVIDSIKRPVFMEHADLNNDKKEDLVVCAFGNYGGNLLAYENTGDGKYIKHVISSLPGARKVVVKDFNNDGLNDILVMFSQGDEQISLYTNAGSFRFRITTLLHFPPVYGSAYFDLVDFNKDGHWDIVYANGDNADYSKIRKPYHGVRVFLNNGQNKFTESWFAHLDGCSMAIARDFDKDGDIDIATTSFFPDFNKQAERGFVYFENVNGVMEPFVTPLAADGRWLLMEPVDLDSDGYLDLLLAALNFDTEGTSEMDYRWKQNPVDILVLKNASPRSGDKGKK